jgi:uncharacterized protein YdgA (DUF945 family)
VKKSLAVLVVLILLYPAIPWLLGRSIEKRMNELDDQLQAKTPYLTVTRSPFKRGWFTSEQDLTLAFTGTGLPAVAGASPAANVPYVTIHNVIHHGLICGPSCFGRARIESTLEYSPELKAAVQKLAGTTDVIALSTRLDLAGGYTATLTSPAFKDIAVGTDAHLSTDGLSLTLSQDAGAVKTSVHGKVPHIAYSAPASGSFEMTALALDSDTQRVLGKLSDGTATLTIAKVAVNAPKGAFSAADLLFGATLSSDAGFMSIALKYDTGAIAAATVNLSSVHFDFTLRHLDMVALDALNTAISASNQDTTVSPADRAAKNLQILQEQGTALLLKQPELAIDRVSIATSGGEALINGVLRLHDFAASDLAPGADPKLLLAKVESNLDFSCDEGLLTSLPNGANFDAQLKAFAQQGLVTLEAGKFHSKIQFRDGQPTFNGKSLGGGPAPAAIAPPAPRT